MSTPHTLSQSLEVYVFDDTATDDNYAGVAQVPLEALARGETATGIFQFSTVRLYCAHCTVQVLSHNGLIVFRCAGHAPYM